MNIILFFEMRQKDFFLILFLLWKEKLDPLSNNLQEEYETIMQYLEKNNFKIFFTAKLVVSTAQANWDNSHEWQKFFEIAKDNTDLIFVESEIIDQEKISEINKLKEDDPRLKLDLQRYSNQMVMFAFSWIKDNVKHELKKTEGPVDIIKKLTEFAEDKKLEVEVGLEDEEEEIPSESEIEKKFVEYMDVGGGHIRDKDEKYERERYIKHFFADEIDFGWNVEGKKRKILRNLEPKFDEMLLKRLTERQETFNKEIPEMVKKYVEYRIENKIDKKISSSGIADALGFDDWSEIRLLHDPIQKAWKKYVNEQKEKIPEYVQQALEWMKENNSTKFPKSQVAIFMDDKGNIFAKTTS